MDPLQQAPGDLRLQPVPASFEQPALMKLGLLDSHSSRHNPERWAEGKLPGTLSHSDCV